MTAYRIITTPGHWREVHFADADCRPGGHSCRPVAVIDPEDREQVQRLERAMDREFSDRGWANLATPDAEVIDAVQAAIRSLIAPPKPPEPKGLGAVVEAIYDNRFIRVSTGDHPWQRVSDVEGEHLCAWADIVAVKVLSEGVKP